MIYGERVGTDFEYLSLSLTQNEWDRLIEKFANQGRASFYRDGWTIELTGTPDSVALRLNIRTDSAYFIMKPTDEPIVLPL